MSLFTPEQLEEMYSRAQQQQAAEQQRKFAKLQANRPFVYQERSSQEWEARATPQTRAEKCESDRQVLLEIVRDNEFPGCTIEELATAASRSKSWVRATLRKNGIVLAKPVRRNDSKGEK